MGFNEELYTMALKPVTGKENVYSNYTTEDEIPTLALKPVNSAVLPSSTTSIKFPIGLAGKPSQEVEVNNDLPSTNVGAENFSKMTTKTKKIVLASVVGVALGVIIFIVIKNRK